MTHNKDDTPLTYQKVTPEKDVQSYLFSKTTNAVLKKVPEWDIPRREPEVELVAKKRYLHEVETRLAAKNTQAKEIRELVDGQWKELEDREDILRDNFIKFNAFIKENQEKRERVEHKMAEEIALIAKRRDDIEELQKNYDRMLYIRFQMEDNIKNHAIYEEFIGQVVKIYPFFKSVTDILDRYETLADARIHLADKHREDLAALEESRNEMLKNTEEKTISAMRLNYVVAELQSRYETAKNKALQWEAMVTRIKDTSALKIAELDQVRRATWNVYLQMCKRKEIEPKLEHRDVENQLLFIKQTLGELKRIIKNAKKKAEKDGYIVK